MACGGLAQELPQVRARAAEAACHRVAHCDQLHYLLAPVGEGGVELAEQPLNPPSRRRSRGEELVHGVLYPLR